MVPPKTNWLGPEIDVSAPPIANRPPCSIRASASPVRGTLTNASRSENGKIRPPYRDAGAEIGKCGHSACPRAQCGKRRHDVKKRERLRRLGFPESRVRLEVCGHDRGNDPRRVEDEEAAKLVGVQSEVEVAGHIVAVRVAGPTRAEKTGIDVTAAGDGVQQDGVPTADSAVSTPMIATIAMVV